MSCSAY